MLAPPHSPSRTDTEALLCRGASKCGGVVSSCITLHNLQIFLSHRLLRLFSVSFFAAGLSLDTIYHSPRRCKKVKLQEVKTSDSGSTLQEWATMDKNHLKKTKQFFLHNHEDVFATFWRVTACAAPSWLMQFHCLAFRLWNRLQHNREAKEHFSWFETWSWKTCSLVCYQ